MAEATFSLAVENLGDLLIEKVDILRGLEGPVKGLKDELERMQHFLRDAVEKQANDTTMCDWISQLREVAQDAEDVIETFISKVDISGPGAGSRGLLEGFASSLNHVDRVGEEIQSIRCRLQEIIRIGERYNFFKSVYIHTLRRLEDVELQHVTSTTPWQDDEDVVGLEEDVALLLRRAILDERSGLSVAGIVGMAGIGKTTLARKLFNHAEVAGRFDQRRAWVMISREFSTKEIIKQLVLQMPMPGEDQAMILERMEGLQLGSLQLLLLQRLRGSPYFIVLDDVWEDAHWEALQVFPGTEDNASRLLITSRNRHVARHAHFVHEMKPLHPIQSWELFLKTVYFRNIDINCPEHLEIIGREICRKCHNLPSAIKETGRQLVERRSVAEWEEVLDTMDFNVMSDAFELSYHELPPKLKLCFLCLGLFKENATIREEKLVQVWIAGGMVPQRGQMNEIMEEMARSYLDNLVSRNMVQVEDKTKDHRVKNCHIYDVFHKPAIKKAEDEISLEILREDGNSRPINKPRHRAIYCSRESFIYSMNQDNYIRSLFFHGGGNFDGSLSYWNSFELLRILDFEGFGLQEFPEVICSLTGLRYLGLRNNYIVELPEALGCLQNLKVLDIALNFAVVVPDVIWRMDSLRHLYMSEIICKTPLKIDTLKNLRTLTYISVDNWTYERSSLQMMTSLRKLGIEELNEHSDVSSLFTSLAHLENLVCLNLKGSRFNRMPSLDEVGYLHRLTQLRLDGLLTTLPSADNFPPNLCYLTLVNTSLEQDPMPVLEKLPKLLYLKLRNAYTGVEMVISHEGFTKLQVLCIGELWHLINVEIEEGAMPMLERFEISNCPYLENLPRRARIID